MIFRSAIGSRRGDSNPRPHHYEASAGGHETRGFQQDHVAGESPKRGACGRRCSRLVPTAGVLAALATGVLAGTAQARPLPEVVTASVPVADQFWDHWQAPNNCAAGYVVKIVDERLFPAPGRVGQWWRDSCNIDIGLAFVRSRNPADVCAIVVHEIGHARGQHHQPGTIMDPQVGQTVPGCDRLERDLYRAEDARLRARDRARAAKRRARAVERRRAARERRAHRNRGDWA